MVRFYWILLFAFLPLVGVGQSAYKGKLNLYAGGGIVAGTSHSNFRWDGSGMGMVQYRLALDYNTHKEISFGAEYWNQGFVENRGVDSINTMNSNMLGLSLRFSFMDREKSNMSIGTSVGMSDLEISVKEGDNLAALLGKGSYNSIYLTWNKYFGKSFGLYSKFGFMNIPYQMTSLTYNGANVDHFAHFSLDEWKVLLRGGFLNAGLTYMIGNNDKSNKDIVDE